MTSAGRQQRRFAPEPWAVAEARDFVRAAIAATAIDHDAAVLMTDELAANAVIHAGTPFTVGVMIDDQAVRIEVTDAAPHLQLRPRDLNLLAPNGRGILIVNRLASSWGADTNDHSKRVWFECRPLPS